MYAYEALAGHPIVRVFRNLSQEDEHGEPTPQLGLFAVDSHRPVPPFVYGVSHGEAPRNSFKIPFGGHAGTSVYILAITGARKVGINIS